MTLCPVGGLGCITEQWGGGPGFGEQAGMEERFLARGDSGHGGFGAGEGEEKGPTSPGLSPSSACSWQSVWAR